MKAILSWRISPLLNTDPGLALNWLGRLDAILPVSALAEYYRAEAFLQQNDAPLALTTIQKVQSTGYYCAACLPFVGSNPAGEWRLSRVRLTQRRLI